MPIIMISIFATLIGIGLFELGVKTILLTVFINLFKVLVVVVMLGSLYLIFKKVRG